MPEISGTSIEKLISGVKRAIGKAQKERATNIVALNKLELILKGLVEKGGGGELEIKIPIIGTGLGLNAEVKSTEGQTIHLILVPPKDALRTGIRGEDFEEELFVAIMAICDGIEEGAEGEPKFILENAFVELNFGINTKGNISLLAKGSGQSDFTQTIKLFFGPPVPGGIV